MGNQQLNYDVIIVGAGLVGASLAAALAQYNFKVLILETHLPNVLIDSVNSKDPRPLTLNHASKQIMDNLGLWETLHPETCTINQIIVSEQGRFGKTRFNAEDFQLPALGYVVPFASLHKKLYQLVAESSSVTIKSIHQLTAIHCEENGVSVNIDSGAKKETFNAKLLVGADGSQSTTRKMMKLPVQEYPATEQALIYTLNLKDSHQHKAYERFTKKGVLALLPLFNDHQVRLVWTLPKTTWLETKEWNHEQLEDYLNKCFQSYVGKIEVTKSHQSFPLQMLVAKQSIAPGFVLLGNAAHTIYPLAAQGFNLGLSDVAALCDVLVDAIKHEKSLGSLEVLKKYTHWRQPQQLWISQSTQWLNQLFGINLPLIGKCRSTGLLLTDLCSPFKRHLGKRWLGLAGKLPNLALATIKSN